MSASERSPISSLPMKLKSLTTQGFEPPSSLTQAVPAGTETWWVKALELGLKEMVKSFAV